MFIYHDDSDDELLKAATYLGRWVKTKNLLYLVLASQRLDKARSLWCSEFGDKPMRREYRVYSAYLLRRLGQCANAVKTAKTNADVLEALHLSFPANGAAEAMRKHDSSSWIETKLLFDAGIRGLYAEQRGIKTPKANYEKLAESTGATPGTLRKRASELGLSPPRAKRSKKSNENIGLAAANLSHAIASWLT